MGVEKTGFDRRLSVMPEGWKDKAKELGALVREIKNPAGLLRLVFLYLTDGKSFSGTAALPHPGGICSITRKAVFTRFQKCGEWLRRLCENIYRNSHAIREAPQWLGERKVYMADAGDEPVHGSGFLFRFGTKRFHIYNRQGRKVNILGYFKGLKPGETGEKTLYYEYEGEYKPLRFCVLRKTKEAEERGLKALMKTRMRKRGNKELGKAQTACNRYVIIVTSISEAAPELILDLYRQRWQIELAFKRLKSLFKYHGIPVRVEAGVRAWFYGKLLLAALCETWVNEGRFSPSAGRSAR